MSEDGTYNESVVPSIVNKVTESFHSEGQISITKNGIGGEDDMKSFYQVIPGFAVMFLLFSILGGSGKLIEERQNKTLRRILVSSAKRSDLIIGKWIGMTLVGFLQSIILFLVGTLIFRISLGNNPINLLVFLLVAASCSGAIGVFIASVSKSMQMATGLAMLLFMVMSALGGSWWALDITPSFMQKIGHFTFNYWAISGIKKLILFNQSLAGVGVEMLVMISITCVFVFLSFKVFKVE